jgi:phage tail sheath protein FI
MNESAIATPGVYVNEISVLPPSVAQVATAIPAFIGYTQDAKDADGNPLKLKPTKIYNLKEYEQYFGTVDLETKIEVAVILSSTTGVSSAIAKFTADPNQHNLYYSMRLYFDNGGGPCYIVSVEKTTTAVAFGDLEKGVKAVEAFDEPTLFVVPEGKYLSPSDHYKLMQEAMDQCFNLGDRFTILDVHEQLATTDLSMTAFRAAPELAGHFNYGAAYYPDLKTLYEYDYDETKVDLKITKDGAPVATAKLDTFKATEGAAYNAAKDAIRKLKVVLPPSPAIAGIYASVDADRGVWKAPANVGVRSIYDLVDNVTDAEQATMNIDTTAGKSVNAIRAFNGKGILVWGARTLDGNSAEWKYIPVRRFFIMVEESAKKATAQFVFEPNDANTWTKIRAMIENYLTLLWREGALAGAKPEHAFFVKCGLGQTMTAQDILDGKLIVEIGMAAVRPAEFIILRFMHKLQES